LRIGVHNRSVRNGRSSRLRIHAETEPVLKRRLAAPDPSGASRRFGDYEGAVSLRGGTLEYEREVNVTLTNGKEKTFVYYVTDEAGCDPRTGGWYYDIKPSVGTPTKIIACPTTCSAFQAAPNGASVSIELGCLTVIK